MHKFASILQNRRPRPDGRFALWLHASCSIVQHFARGNATCTVDCIKEESATRFKEWLVANLEGIRVSRDGSRLTVTRVDNPPQTEEL